MKSMRLGIATFAIAVCILGLTSASSYAQRSVGAQTFVLDDGSGHTVTLQINGTLSGNVISYIAIPPAGNPPAGFVNKGNATGQLLYWNNTNVDWETVSAGASNTILHGNGVAAPSFSSVNLNSADVSSILPINNGGTGTNSVASNNLVFAGPSSGAPGAPSFRLLVGSDLPGGGGAYIQNQNAAAQAASYWISGSGVVGSGFNISGGVLNMGGTQVIDASRNLTNIGNIGLNGAINTATTLNLAAPTAGGNGTISINGTKVLNVYSATAGGTTANLFVGGGAGNFTMTGFLNVGVGPGALASDAAGGENTAVGVSAMNALATGYHNTAVGSGAMSFHDPGSQNTAVGEYALTSLNNPAVNNNNVGIGYQAGNNITNGTNNTIVGTNAGQAIIGGSNNVFVGNGANASGDISNAIAIGSGATVTASNAVQIGAPSTTAVNLTGAVTGTSSAAFTGAVSGSAGTFTGAVSGASGAFTGTVNAGTFSGSGSGLTSNTVPAAAVNAVGVTNGWLLTASGGTTVWAAPPSTFNLPFTGSASSAGAVMSITNSGTGDAIAAIAGSAGNAVTATGNVAIKSPTATASQLQIQSPSNGNSTTIKAATGGAAINYTLPATAPSAIGQVLTTTSSGANTSTSWQTPSLGITSFVRSPVTGPTTYAALSTDNIIGVNCTAGAVTVNLPAASSVASGYVMVINDEYGQAGTNNITINVHAGDSFPWNTGSTTQFVIGFNGGILRLYSDGASNWFSW